MTTPSEHSEDIARLAVAMKALRGEPADDATMRWQAGVLVSEVRTSPLNPHGDNEKAIVDDLIATIEAIREETWGQVIRMIIRGNIKGI